MEWIKPSHQRQQRASLHIVVTIWKVSNYSPATTNVLNMCALEYILALIDVHIIAMHNVWLRSTRRPFHSCAIQDDHTLPLGILL